MDLDFEWAYSWSADLGIQFLVLGGAAGGGAEGGISKGTVTATYEKPFGFSCVVDPNNERDPWWELKVLNGDHEPE